MSKPPTKKPLRLPTAKPSASVTISAVTAFIDEITAFAATDTKFKCYRGQRDAAWENIPALFRPDLAGLEDNEKRAVRDLISVHPHEFSTDETMFDKLVRMQHFGLPTRLMDVSQNPLVALWFATDPGPDGAASDGVVTGFTIPPEREKYFDSDSVSCLANLANMTKVEKAKIVELRRGRSTGATKKDEVERTNRDENVLRLLHFIKVEKPHFLPIINPIDLFKPYYVHPKMSNRRILSQAGGFIIHGLRPPKRISYAQRIEEKRFIVPAAAKAKVRRTLEQLGISESTLFPELDRAAKRIERSYAYSLTPP